MLGTNPSAAHQIPGQRPAIVYFKLFDNCNLRCNMCDCWELPATRLRDTSYEQVLEQVLVARPHSVRLTGGEPLLYPRLPELIAQIASSGSRPSTITNALLLSKRLPVLLQAGLREIVVSIDGTSASHDLIRGRRRAFARLDNGLADLTGADGLRLGVNTVVQRLNIDDLEAILAYLTSLRQRPAWWHLIPIRDNEALAPSPAHVDAYPAQLSELAERAADSGIRLIGGPFDHSSAPCSVPRSATYVNGLTGEVFGCNMLAYVDAPIGDLRKDDLAGILGATPSQRLRQATGEGTHPPCVRCDAGSRAMNQHLFARAAGA